MGSSKFQTFFESTAIGLALRQWGRMFTKNPLAVLGDNTGSLNNRLAQKGQGLQLKVAREIAWRRARGGWLVGAGHIPCEGNEIADALSRLAQGYALPRKLLQDAEEVHIEPVATFWKCC